MLSETVFVARVLMIFQGGAYKIYDKDFTFLTVHGCGHTIPTYCPQKGYYFFQKWLQDDL